MQYQRADLAYFPYQIEYALNHYQPHQFHIENFRNVVIGGLGGSGIAGHFVKNFFYDKATLPIEVVSEYRPPDYVDKNTMLILSSYSGNTEETLELAEWAQKREATVLTITTGGALEKLAKKNGWPVFYAESGFQPRMALGYSLTYLLLVLNELMGLNYEEKLREIAEDTKDTEYIISMAEGYFHQLKDERGHKFIILTDHHTFPVGLRFCQQLQENAKTEAFVHRLPEANHNVIESYYGDLKSHFILLNSHWHTRLDVRFDFVRELLEKNGNQVLEIPLKDHSLRQLINTTFLLDWMALLTADKKAVNSLEIPNIKALKSLLSKS